MLWRDKHGDIEHGAQSVATNEHLSTFTQEYTADGGGDIAAVTLITPASEKKLAAEVVFMVTDGASGNIQIDFVTSSTKVFRMYPSKNTQSDGTGMHIIGATDEVLTLQATSIGNGAKVFVIISYVEHD